MFRKPIFWIVFGLFFVGSILFTLRYFSAAFPLVNLDLQMDRATALARAQTLAQQHGWGPEGWRQAASFRLDGEVQNYVELEAGGNEAFNELLAGNLYAPYTWRVRHFKEGENNETLIRFTPQGEPYGFVEKLAEEAPGASLPADSARAIAEAAAIEQWGIDLTAYTLAEASQEERLGGRIDHTFVYERPDVQIGEGRYRLRLVVGGDRLTELSHFIKIPEAFKRRYEEMRSANTTISSVSVIAMALLYIVGGCIVGLFFLLRQHWVIWRKPLFWGLFVSFLQVLAGINQWPLLWMSYDTAVSTQSFALQQIANLLIQFLGLGLLLSISFMAAESLSRRAFPHHIQQWRLWSPEVAGTLPVLGRTLGGYLLVGFFWAYEVGLYFMSSRALGWWSPSDALFHPDVLAVYFPWLTSIAISAQAGFWEESLFRAVPIAGAALLGQRFGGRRIWIGAALVIQALVFGAAHATYPQQPAYARVVELIIPSLAFAGLYLYFGLLPAIVLHFTVDVVAFALPLFVASAPGIWGDRVLVIVLALVPLWVVLGGRGFRRRWREVGEENLNRSWAPAEQPAPVEVTTPTGAAGRDLEAVAAIGLKTRWLLLLGGLAGLVAWGLTSHFQNDAPTLNIDRDQAIALAHRTLAERGIELPESWQALATVVATPNQEDRFVWQTGGQTIYQRLLGRYLTPPHWKIRFVQFTGDVAERAEEYQVFISGAGKVIRVRHRLPEARPGASLMAEEARGIAHATLQTNYQLASTSLKEISAVPEKLTARQDWTFTYADTAGYALAQGEARIVVEIAGAEVVDSYRHIHVPEEWSRQERSRRLPLRIVQVLCIVVLVLVFLSGVIGAIVSWSHKNFNVRVFLGFGGLLLGLGIIGMVNSWPGIMAQFSTAQPLQNQVLLAIGFGVVALLFSAAGVALVVGFIQRWPGSDPVKGGFQLLEGLSVGALVAGLLALMASLGPSLQPTWAAYSALASYLPILEAGLDPLSGYIFQTALLLLVFSAVDRFSQGWTRRRSLWGVLLVLLGLLLSGANSIESIPLWLGTGLAIGLVLLLVYHGLLRFQLALIPVAVAIPAILSQLQQGFFRAYPAALTGALVAVVLIGLLASWWGRLQRGE